MTIALRRLRAVLIALVALAMSASLTFAAAAPQASFGLARSMSHAGTSAGSGDEVTTGEDEDTETDETDEDAGDGADNCTTDPTDPATDLTALTHGQIVCWAAHQETPEGYKNHGAWVSSWARGENGTQAPAKQHGKSNGKSQKD
jgi:hypothetical protein